MKPDFQIVDEWCGMFLRDGFASVRWITTNGGLSQLTSEPQGGTFGGTGFEENLIISIKSVIYSY